MAKNILSNNELFAKVLSGDISASEKKEFENWLSLSDKNLSEFQQYKKLWELSGFVKKRDLAIAKLKTEVKILKKSQKQRSLLSYLQKAAAVLIIPVLIFSGYLLLNNDKNEVASYNDTLETIQTPLGGRTSFILPDSSVVWLNAGSEISFHSSFAKSREVKLDGEMYIEVKKGKSPFVVKTKYGDVKVYGTKFNVSAYDDESFKTTLLEGSVAVSDKAQDEKLTLKPGYQAVLNNGVFEVERVDVYDYISWKDGKLILHREPIESVVNKLERWFNVKIVLKGNGLKNLWYTGTIEMETFSEVLDLIKHTTPIKYNFNSKTRILTIESNLNDLPMNK